MFGHQYTNTCTIRNTESTQKNGSKHSGGRSKNNFYFLFTLRFVVKGTSGDNNTVETTLYNMQGRSFSSSLWTDWTCNVWRMHESAKNLQKTSRQTTVFCACYQHSAYSNWDACISVVRSGRIMPGWFSGLRFQPFKMNHNLTHTIYVSNRLVDTFHFWGPASRYVCIVPNYKW